MPSFGNFSANEERKSDFGNASDFKSMSIAVPPAASPTGLPKKSPATDVARLAVWLSRCELADASGSYVASAGFKVCKRVMACWFAGWVRSILVLKPYCEANPCKAASTFALELSPEERA